MFACMSLCLSVRLSVSTQQQHTMQCNAVEVNGHRTKEHKKSQDTKRNTFNKLYDDDLYIDFCQVHSRSVDQPSNNSTCLSWLKPADASLPLLLSTPRHSFLSLVHHYQETPNTKHQTYDTDTTPVRVTGRWHRGACWLPPPCVAVPP